MGCLTLELPHVSPVFAPPSSEFSDGIFDMLEGYPGRGKPVIQIHATLDDVGTCGNDGMCAVVGYVAYSEDWKAFNGRWLYTLAELKMEQLHTAHYLNQFPLVGGNLDDDTVCLILAPFIETVKQTLLARGAVPICVATDCEAYEQLSQSEKKFIRPPDEHSFEVAVLHSIRAMGSSFQITDAISIQMDESSNVPRLYSRYEYMKRQHAELKAHLGAICFLDDKRHPPVQAADMLGNIVLKSSKAFMAGLPLPRSMQELTFVNGVSKFQLIHFDGPKLKSLAQSRMKLGDKMAVGESVPHEP
jgi:hypothetical protein